MATARHLYRSLISAGKSFPDYNIQSYILRRTREEFRLAKALGPEAVAAKLEQARETLQVIQRQAVVAGFYKGEASVMESLPPQRTGSK